MLKYVFDKDKEKDKGKGSWRKINFFRLYHRACGVFCAGFHVIFFNFFRLKITKVV